MRLSSWISLFCSAWARGLCERGDRSPVTPEGLPLAAVSVRRPWRRLVPVVDDLAERLARVALADVVVA